MPTYTPLYARSPRFISISGTHGQVTRIDLYVWNDPSSEPASPTHVLTKPIIQGYNQCNYDISPYIREYISHDDFTEVTADTAADTETYARVRMSSYLDGVLVTTAYFIAFDGYGYFEDGYNPLLTATTTPPHLTEGTYYVRDNGSCGGVFYNDDQAVTWGAKWTGLTTAGTTTVSPLSNEYGYVPYVHPSYVGEGNKLEIIRDGSTVATYYFKEYCEPRYTPVVCDFINKYGSWQQLIFFKRSKTKVDMSNEEYMMFPSALDYSETSNIKQTFNTNLQESITVNTGWVVEGYSEVIKQLMLSQKILLDHRPVTIDTKSIDIKEHLSDKVINYEIMFKYANHKLNYII